MTQQLRISTSQSSNSMADSFSAVSLQAPLSSPDGGPVTRSATGPQLPANHESFKKRVFFFLDEPDSSIYAKLYLHVNYILTMISTVGVLAQTVVDSDWNEFEHTMGVILFIDLVLRIYASPRFWTNGYNYIDLLNAIPYIIYLSTTNEERSTNDSLVSFIWLMRVVLRLFKITRYFTGFQLLLSSVRLSAVSLVTPLFFLMVLCVLFGVFLQFFEQDQSTNMFNSMFDGIWFGLVSLSTTGYGDKFPVTTGGKLFTAIFLVIGILYTAIPIAIMGANFSDVWNSRDEILVVQKTKQRLSDLGIKEDDVKQAFRVFDTDGSGDIDIEEFKQLVVLLKLGLQEKKTVHLFKAFDKDGSGNISYGEFAKTMFPGTIFTKEELEKQSNELKKKTTPAKDPEALNRRLLKNINKLKHGANLYAGASGPGDIPPSSSAAVELKVKLALDDLLAPLEHKVRLYRQAKFGLSSLGGSLVSVTPPAHSSTPDAAISAVSALPALEAVAPASPTKPHIPPVELSRLPASPHLPNQLLSSSDDEKDSSLSSNRPAPAAAAAAAAPAAVASAGTARQVPRGARLASTSTERIVLATPVLASPAAPVSPAAQAPASGETQASPEAGPSSVERAMETQSAMHFFVSPGRATSPCKSPANRLRPISAAPLPRPAELPAVRPQAAPLGTGASRPVTAPAARSGASPQAGGGINDVPSGVRTPRLPEDNSRN